MPQLAGALTLLGLLALPAIPSPSYLAAKAASGDTWSLQISDSSSLALNTSKFGSDAWTLGFVDSGAIIVAADIAGSDSWSVAFAEATALRTYPSEKTQLSMLALPGAYGSIAPKSVALAIGGSDTWALTYGFESAASAVAANIAGSDGWSVSLLDSSALATYPRELTQLSGLALPGRYIAITAKSVSSALNVGASDSWALTWTETPTDLVQTETSDTWRLAFATESLSLSVSQVFGGADSWSLNWLDVASVFAGGPILQSVADTWPVLLFDATSVAATVDAADTWTISIADSSAIDISTDSKDGTDSWDLSFALETASFSQVVDIPILGSDEWIVLFDESSGLIRPAVDISPRRLILIVRASRSTDV